MRYIVTYEYKGGQGVSVVEADDIESASDVFKRENPWLENVFVTSVSRGYKTTPEE